MRRRFRSYFRTQFVLSIATVGLFSFLFFATGIFDSEERFVQEEIAPVQHRKLEQRGKPVPPKKVTLKDMGQLSQTATVLDHHLQKSLFQIAQKQMVAPESIQLSQKSYGWLKGLMSDDQKSVLHLLKRMPVAHWERQLKSLQELPKQDLRTHLRRFKPMDQEGCEGRTCDL